MSDRRTMPDPNLVDGSSPARVAVTMTDLLARPGGPRDRQLIFGEEVTVLGGANGHSYVKATRDGYVGFVTADILEPSSAPTHWVTAPATHAYEAANFKSPDLMPLSFGSRVVAIDTNAKFFETNKGFVPSQHLAPIESRAEDPLEIATLFLGTPYLWGGNSRWGLDCSGLVQAALLACGIPCPGDSDQQMEMVGHALQDGAEKRRGDLLFWKGHVAFVIDPETMLHANVHHMSVAYENLTEAIERIEAQGDGPVIGHRRFL
ncbi:MAG: NlpC/P60 family protein [Pseudomonadota bacterium]